MAVLSGGLCQAAARSPWTGAEGISGSKPTLRYPGLCFTLPCSSCDLAADWHAEPSFQQSVVRPDQESRLGATSDLSVKRWRSEQSAWSATLLILPGQGGASLLGCARGGTRLAGGPRTGGGARKRLPKAKRRTAARCPERHAGEFRGGRNRGTCDGRACGHADCCR